MADQKPEPFDAFLDKLSEIGVALDVEVKGPRAGVYWKVLKRYPVDKLMRALEAVLENETDKRFPTIADIRKYIEPLTDPRNKPQEYPDLG